MECALHGEGASAGGVCDCETSYCVRPSSVRYFSSRMRQTDNTATDNMRPVFCASLSEFPSKHIKPANFPCFYGVENILRTPLRKGLSKTFRVFPNIVSELYENFLLNKKAILVLLILLNLLFAAGAPSHRVRHRHLRHVLRADRLCDKPGVVDQPTHEECEKPRVRRDVNIMSLAEGQHSSLCPYSVCIDEDVNRKPVRIHRVICLQSGCRCTQEGAYRCTQLYNKVEVWYGSSNQTMEVEYGCVCAARHGNTVDNFQPDSVDK